MADKTKVKVRKYPLAFGMTYWGPLPGTRDAYLFWGGPGDGLAYHPVGQDGPGMPVRHPAGRGPFQTLREAQRAVDAMVAAYLADEDGES